MSQHEQPLVIIAGGSRQHSAVVYEAACEAGRPVLGYISADGRDDVSVADLKPLGLLSDIGSGIGLSRAQYVVAVGSNAERKRLARKLLVHGLELGTIVHPRAIVSPSSTIGVGSVILAGAIVGTAAKVGNSCIINHNASVDHNCVVADYVNICPGARLGGSARVEDSVFIGLNACVLQGVVIGNDSVIGAGAVVLTDVAPNQTMVGVPARRLNRKST